MPMSSPLEIKRHYSELSEKETAEVIEILADMVVTHLKSKQKPTRPAPLRQGQPNEQRS